MMYKAIAVLFLLAVASLSASVAQDGPKSQTTTHAEAKNQMHTPADMARQMQTMNTMMVKLLGGADREYEKRFIDLMTPHHEGAIAMAKDALKHAKQPEIKAMAEKMIRDQQAEIEELKNLRTKWYGVN